MQTRPWYKDLCDYYGVTPEQALKLGTRAKGRKPDLPASATTHTVSNMTLEDIWAMRTRETPSDISAFYKDAGAWFSFRQVVYHMNNNFDFITKQIVPGMRICEYGAGVAPLCYWIISHISGIPLKLTIVDVPSEHLTFGNWRLNRLIKELNSPISVEMKEVMPDKLPLDTFYDLIAILEVFEHLHNPLEVTQHLCEHLSSDGFLWENYMIAKDDSGPNLAISQRERSEAFEYLKHNCKLIFGNAPEASDGGGTRCWQRF